MADLPSSSSADRKVMKRPAAADTEDADQDPTQDHAEQDPEQDRQWTHPPLANIDIAKKRKFDQIFDSLPQEIKDAYEANRGKSGKQRITTQIINDSIQRQGSRLIARNKASPWLMEVVVRSCKKYHDQYGSGMILEEAETKCGGSQNLARAVNAGRIKKQQNAAGIDLYYFPREKVGQKEEVGWVKQGKQRTSIDDEAMAELKDSLTSFQAHDAICDAQKDTSLYIEK